MSKESVYCELLSGICLQKRPGCCGKQESGFLGFGSKPCPVAFEFLLKRSKTILEAQHGLSSKIHSDGEKTLLVDFNGINSQNLPGGRLVDSLEVESGNLAINGMIISGNWEADLPEELIEFIETGKNTTLMDISESPRIYNN